jgi:hypothetical protein
MLSGSHAGASLPGSQLPARMVTRLPFLATEATRVPRKPRVEAEAARVASAIFG